MAARRVLAEHMINEYQVSVWRTCDVIEALIAAVECLLRWGFWKCFDWLRLDGHACPHKRVHRVYCALQFNQTRQAIRAPSTQRGARRAGEC
jgi:putative transposase